MLTLILEEYRGQAVKKEQKNFEGESKLKYYMIYPPRMYRC